MMKLFAAVCMLAFTAVPVRADVVIERWGNAANVQHAETVKYEPGKDGATVTIDLSALPKDAKVFAARLFMSPVKWNDPSFELTAGEQPLKLVEPYGQWYDATVAARAWAKAGSASIGVRKGPKVDPDAIALELTYQGQAAAKPPRQVAGVKAIYRSGQVFVTFVEIEPLDGGKEQVSWADLAGKFRGDYYGPLADPKAQFQVTYLVYTHDKPITAQSIGEAALVAEVPPGSALNTRMSLQVDPAKQTQQMVAANAGRSGEGLSTGPQVMVLRLAVEPGKPVPPGAGICVHTVTQEGKAYYAVLTAVNGLVNTADISEANSVGPVEQKKAPPEPVMYLEIAASVGGVKHVQQWYSYWTVQPLSPWPGRYDVVVGYCPDLLGKPASLHLARGGWNVWPAAPGPQKTTALTLSHAADEPVDMGVGELESMRSQKGFTHARFIAGFPNRLDALVKWAKATWPIDPNNVSANMGDWGMQELRRGQAFCIIRGWGLPEYTKGFQTWQRATGQWGPPALYQGRPEGEDPYALSNLTDYVLANPGKELPFLIMYARGGSHFSEMGWPPVPRFLAAMEKTKRAFIFGGKGSPAEEAINKGQIELRLDMSVPAFAHCTLNDNPGEGELRSGESFSALLNGYVLWDGGSIVDEPGRYEITLWVADTSYYPDCWVDMTPRRCQQFKAAPGAKFTWTNTLIEAPPLPGAKPAKPSTASASATAATAARQIQSGTATADENGLVSLEKIGLTKGRHRIEIKAQ